MLRFSFLASVLALVLLLTACPNDPPPPPPPLPCDPNCIEPKVVLTYTLKAPPTSSLFASYTSGEAIQGDIDVKLEDPDKVINQAAVFVNTVECLPSSPADKPCRDVEQEDIRNIFDESRSSIEPDLNKKVFTGDELRAALKTTVNGFINSSLSEGRFSLVIQIFNCTNTDPNSVGSDPNCKIIDNPRAYRFEIQ